MTNALAMIADAIGHDAKALPFFVQCFTASPHVSDVKRLSVPHNANTFFTRFYRADLPSPKRYLTEARLVRVRDVWERHRDWRAPDVAHYMKYSSPNALHRYVRKNRGVALSEWYATTTAHGETVRYVETLVLPYVARLRAFDPFACEADAFRNTRHFTHITERAA